MERTPRVLRLTAAALVLAAGPLGAQQRDTTPPRPGVEPRATARDLVRADDRTCDDLCRRERMMDSLYGRDRERRPAAVRAPSRPSRRTPRAARPASPAPPATPPEPSRTR